VVFVSRKTNVDLTLHCARAIREQLAFHGSSYRGGRAPTPSAWNLPARLLKSALENKIAERLTLRRALRGVIQKALTQALRRLERSGMISRTVLETSPVWVEYAITPLGRTLAGPYSTVYRWIRTYHSEVEAAQRCFDARRQQARAA
jgi:DNA-binding HxlR family transcriptional regulator